MKKFKTTVVWEVVLTEAEEKEYLERKDEIETNTVDWLQDELGSDFTIALKTELVDETCQHEFKNTHPITGDPLKPVYICEKCGVRLREDLTT